MRNKIVIAVATVLGAGFFPVASGTFASLLAAGFFWLVLLAETPLQLIAISMCALGGFLTAGRAERLLGKDDPREVVIDEVCGMWLALLWVPPDPLALGTAFLLFRIFDICKIPPAGKIEELKGSAGIMGDDLICGLYANLICQVVFRLILKMG